MSVPLGREHALIAQEFDSKRFSLATCFTRALPFRKFLRFRPSKSGRGSSCNFVSARTASLGGRFPGREELPAIPPPRGLADLASARSLNWCACCYRASGTAHPRCRPLSQLFSESRDPRSHKARDVIRRIPWSLGYTSGPVGHNVGFRLSVRQCRAGGNCARLRF